MIGEEDVARAIHAVDGYSSWAALHDTEDNSYGPSKATSIAKARAAISAYLAALEAAGYVVMRHASLVPPPTGVKTAIAAPPAQNGDEALGE